MKSREASVAKGQSPPIRDDSQPPLPAPGGSLPDPGPVTAPANMVGVIENPDGGDVNPIEVALAQ